MSAPTLAAARRLVLGLAAMAALAFGMPASAADAAAASQPQAQAAGKSDAKEEGKSEAKSEAKADSKDQAKPKGESELSKADYACLKCHDPVVAKPALAPKKLGDGKLLDLSVSTHDFIASMHNGTACEDCHDSLDAKTHGKVTNPLASRRALSESMQESCRTCHKKRFKQFEDGIHAALLKQGDEKAPLCSTCHSPHTQPSVKIVQPIEKTPCAQCHKDIFKAYTKDVHGLERVAKGKEAPICSDCHQTHDIKAASFGEGPKSACLNCHKETEKKHKEWLPNADLHFAAISCVACHAPDAKRRVNLRLVDAATQTQLSEKAGVPRFEKAANAADAGAPGLDGGELSRLLDQFNREAGQGKTALRGRLEVQSGVQAHQLAEKDKALKSCETCHSAGAAPFDRVDLTMADANGRPLRHAVDKAVLGSLGTLQSVRGFYAIGSTRIRWLDVLLVLAVLGAVVIVGGHALVMRMTHARARMPGHAAHPAGKEPR